MSVKEFAGEGGREKGSRCGERKMTWKMKESRLSLPKTPSSTHESSRDPSKATHPANATVQLEKAGTLAGGKLPSMAAWVFLPPARLDLFPPRRSRRIEGGGGCEGC